MESAVRRSKGKNQDCSEVFEWFEKYVLPSKLDVSIDHLELVSFSQVLELSVDPLQNSILTFSLEYLITKF